LGTLGKSGGLTMLNVTKITIVKSSGTDTVFLETDLPSGVWPFEGGQSFRTDVARGQGKEYVKRHFPNIPLYVVDVLRFTMYTTNKEANEIMDRKIAERLSMTMVKED
jgi:hypothetical protein